MVVLCIKEGLMMRTTVELDERLVRRAMSAAGARTRTRTRTKKELIHLSLEALVREHRINRLIGRLGRFPLNLTPKALKKLRKDA